MTSHPPSLAREIDAALAWWQAAGVDCTFADDARAWLADPASLASEPRGDPARAAPAQPILAFSHPSGEEAAPAAPQRRDYLGDSPPQSLAAFQRWWMEADLPGTGGLHPRIPPRGAAGARLMVYIASALPCHTPLADLPGLARAGLDTVLAHHVALVAPHRLVLFGQGLETILMRDGESASHPLREINHAPLSTPVMITENLGAMLDMPRLKARFWRRFMEWSA